MSGQPSIFERAVAVPPHVHVREVADELVILSLESEEYFGLDPVGTRIWQLLQSEPTVQRVLESMLDEYDIDEATLAEHLEELLGDLADRRLIELVEVDGPRALGG